MEKQKVIYRRTKKLKDNSRSRQANEVNSHKFLYRTEDKYTSNLSLGTFTVVCECSISFLFSYRNRLLE